MGVTEVDAKLVRMSIDRNCALLTLDTNLAKAQRSGRREGAQPALARPRAASAVVVGDEVDLLLLKAGKEQGQAIGYLDDGTMVVVERARDGVGTEAGWSVTSVLTTANGRLVFAKPTQPAGSRR
jgi:uncharacterized protein YacL